MIASVSGEVLVRRPDHVVVEANGVGYRLAVSAETLKAVPARGKEATLHAHLVARDDAIQLYGFASEEERDLFLHLTSVSGIGPKVAIAVLSSGTPRELLRAIAAGDHKRFQAAPGVGKRTAERVIVELREKVAGELEEGIALEATDEDDPRTMAREGLMHLGYTLTEAEKLLDGAEGESAEDLIGAALRAAASGAKA
jgi:Holliday junction DNA helicase RuvA